MRGMRRNGEGDEVTDEEREMELFWLVVAVVLFVGFVALSLTIH